MRRLRGWALKWLGNARRRRNRYRSLNHVVLNRANALHNVRLIQEQHPGYSIIPVLKANAYGHGLREMAEILNAVSCDLLAVDGYFEAGRIRFLSRHRLLVLGYVLPENVRLLDTRRCSFVVQDLSVLRALAALRKPVRIHLEINTGMNRLGVDCDELSAFLEVFREHPKLVLEGVMTHLADADNDHDGSYTLQQVRRFDECMEQILESEFRPTYVHIAQTAGSNKVHSEYANALRLGIGLYGINPLTPHDTRYETLTGLRPVLSLTSTIIKTIRLTKGDMVSYGNTFTAPHDMRIGVLPLGYYEGVPRSLSNTGCFMRGTVRLPIVGRVCMNHTMIDLANTDARVGDEVRVFSDNPTDPNSIASICAMHKIFPYVLLVKISSSIRRQVMDKEFVAFHHN